MKAIIFAVFLLWGIGCGVDSTSRLDDVTIQDLPDLGTVAAPTDPRVSEAYSDLTAFMDAVEGGATTNFRICVTSADVGAICCEAVPGGSCCCRVGFYGQGCNCVLPHTDPGHGTTSPP